LIQRPELLHTEDSLLLPPDQSARRCIICDTIDSREAQCDKHQNFEVWTRHEKSAELDTFRSSTLTLIRMIDIGFSEATLRQCSAKACSLSTPQFLRYQNS